MRNLWLILLFPAVLWAGPRVYVHGPQDLADHFRLHVQRVKRLGLALYDSHPDDFPGIGREDVKAFLSVHDIAKFNRLAALYSIYGIGYHPPTAELREKVEEIVEGLNEADLRIREAYLRDFPIRAVNSLYRIERIADVVDRNTDPVAKEEFAISLGQEPPLSAFLKEPRDLEMGRELKDRYGDLVADLAYRKCPFTAFKFLE